MALISLRLAIYVAILCISVQLVFPKVARWLSRRALSRKYGCKEPPKLTLDLDYINRKAVQNHNLLETTTRLFNEHGRTYKALRSGRTIVRTCDPRVFKAILSTHFESFGLQPIRYDGGQGFFGNGMLVTDGPQWKLSRSLIRPAFDIAHVGNFDRLKVHVEQFMQLLPRDGSTVDLFPLLKRLTLDISSEFIFGRSLNALSSPNSCKDFMDAFVAAQRDVAVPISQRTEQYRSRCKIVLDYIDDRIDEAINRATEADQGGLKSKQMRIVDELLKTTKDRYNLKYLILSIFSPAHDTVAITVANTIFHLARNPECWATLRAEVSATASQPLTYELLNSFKYLNWVLRETHRITPVGAGTLRECLSTTVIPSGGGKDGQSPLLLERGDWIEMHFRSQHRDRSFWGDDADDFRPERWATIRPMWEYTPFSGGPRICPAIRLVYTECEYILVTLVRDFSTLVNKDEVLEWVEERRLIFQSHNGAKVGLIP